MNTQTIKRQDLKKLYNIACEGWQKRIADLILWDTSGIIEVDNSVIEEAFNAANSDQKKEIKKYFKIISDELFDVTSFEELCKLKGIRVPVLSDFSHCRYPKKALAREKIDIISEVYNNGWKPNFDDHNERKYYPYFTKQKAGSWRFYAVYYGCYSFGGAVGLYKTEKIAQFVGERFKDIYIEVI